MFARSLVCLLLLVATPAWAESLSVLSWNVQGSGSDPEIIAKQLGELGRFDAYCLQEVNPRSMGRLAAAIRDAHGRSYKYIMGSFGNDARLGIVFDTARFELLDMRQLFQQGEYRLDDWNHRPPLVVHLRDKTSDVEFYLVTVHLARGNDDFRLEQARGLRAWASQLDQPAIALGDFNFDYVFDKEAARAGSKSAEDEELNESGVAFTDPVDNPWQWILPATPIDSNWTDDDRDGKDDYPGSLLDLAFLHLPKGWGVAPTAEATVIVREGDFPDTQATSDHRPVKLVLDWKTTADQPQP